MAARAALQHAMPNTWGMPLNTAPSGCRQVTVPSRTAGALRIAPSWKRPCAYVLLQGYTIQGATLDFSINAMVTSPASGTGNATNTDVVSLGPASPVGLSAKASQRCCELLLWVLASLLQA
jgi:hypothetical protein